MMFRIVSKGDSALIVAVDDVENKRIGRLTLLLSVSVVCRDSHMVRWV